MNPARPIRLNVGGKLFMTSADTLQTLPDTRLGRLTQDLTVTSQQDEEIFFDRNPKVMNSILDLYRTGELHVPKNLCGRTVERELEFWQIPQELIRECCFRSFQDCKEDADMTAEIEKFISFPYDKTGDFQKLTMRGKIWLCMERPMLCLLSKIWGVVYFSVVTLSILLYCLESITSLREYQSVFLQELAEKNTTLEHAVANLSFVEKYQLSLSCPWIRHSTDFVTVFFLVELLVRFLACPRKRFFVRQGRNRLDAFLVLQSMVELMLDLTFIEGSFIFTEAEQVALTFFYSFSALKMLRIFYVARDFDVMKILLLSIKANFRELMLLAICLLSLSTLYGTAVYLAEFLTHRLTFSTIPHGMWYAIITMTTVGYGDVVPMSSVGQLLGTLCALTGIVILALPIAVIASKFNKYHDNLSSRNQLRSRVAFLKDRPGFVRHNTGEGRHGDEHCHLQLQTNKRLQPSLGWREKDSRDRPRGSPFCVKARRHQKDRGHQQLSWSRSKTHVCPRRNSIS